MESTRAKYRIQPYNCYSVYSYATLNLLMEEATLYNKLSLWDEQKFRKTLCVSQTFWIISIILSVVFYNWKTLHTFLVVKFKVNKLCACLLLCFWDHHVQLLSLSWESKLEISFNSNSACHDSMWYKLLYTHTNIHKHTHTQTHHNSPNPDGFSA